MGKMNLSKIFFGVFFFLNIGAVVNVYSEEICVDGNNHSKKGSIEYYIAPNGNSLNNGDISHPFASLDDAKKAIRQLKSNHQLKGGVTVWLREGVYELPKSFMLQKEDSGMESEPVIFSGYPNEKVIVSGGKKISYDQVNPISSDAARLIVQKEAIAQIREIDLKALGILDYGVNQITGFRRPYVNAAMELFINGKSYHLARYPNQEKIFIKPENVGDKGITEKEECYPGSIFFDKSKLAQWKTAPNVLAGGNFRFAWATDQLRVKKMDPMTGLVQFADSHMYGISGGEEWNQYYFFNLLEEIDEPGEYYVDHQRGKLYFYPYTELNSADTIMVSMLEDALVTMKGASNIQFRNICFEAGRGIGIYMENTKHNKIEDCTIRNMGVVGVCIGMGSKPSSIYRHPEEKTPFYPTEKLSERIGSLHELLYENTTFNREGGENNGIINCKIENAGCGGISLGGGNRLTLEKAGNYVFNCEFTNCARIDYSYKSLVNIDGVGNKVQHCQFNACPATAIYIHGNDHIIEYNVISEACNFIDDQGAIYLGRDPSEFGNIIRYNFFKNIGHIGRTIAVYYDDGACGTQLYGNVFYKAATWTVTVGGGSYNPIYNNIFIESKLAIHLDNRLDGSNQTNISPNNIFDIRLRQTNYNKPPYSVAYPALATYFNDHPEVPKHNDIKNNIFVNVSQLHDGKSEWGPVHENNIITTKDPGFVDASKLNFSLKENSEVFKILPEFKTIPFSEIGLIKNKTK
ncbi:MAG: right-handed parallel beta-helix repeat-containing protein [Prolixibacteraceae bacterium]|nr:right-handed parallel beta-helix repeat-containing protein [Prolixibacteraceae bacterium]